MENAGGLDVWRLLREAKPGVKANREFVLAAVKRNGLALDYAAKPLKANKEIVLAAVANTGRALRYAAASAKADKKHKCE